MCVCVGGGIILSSQVACLYLPTMISKTTTSLSPPFVTTAPAPNKDLYVSLPHHR